MGADKLIFLFKRQDATLVGKRMDHNGGVLAGFDNFVEIANRSVADRKRQWSVVPDSAFRREKKAAGKVGGSHVLMGGDGNERPLEPPSHKFHETGLTAAGRALEHDRQPARIGGFE